MYTDIYEDHLSMARLFGQEVLVSDDTVPRNIVPKGWNCYDLQGTAEDPWRPVTLVREDDQYHCGAVLSPVPLLEDGIERRPVSGQLETQEEKMTLNDYCRKHGLAQPEDRRRFVLSPDPLPDAPPEMEQIMRDTVAAITGSRAV